jgi:hypothetical protein
VVLQGIILFFIHAQNEGYIFVFSRSGDNNFFGPSLLMSGCFGGIRKEAGGLDNYTHPQILPFDSGGITLSEYFYFPSVYDKAAAISSDISGVEAIAGIPFQQVGIGPGISEVVYRNYLKFTTVVLIDRSQCKSSDPSETVDANFSYHGSKTS